MHNLSKLVPVLFATILGGVSCKETPPATKNQAPSVTEIVPIDSLVLDVEMSTKALEEHARELEKALERL